MDDQVAGFRQTGQRWTLLHSYQRKSNHKSKRKYVSTIHQLPAWDCSSRTRPRRSNDIHATVIAASASMTVLSSRRDNKSLSLEIEIRDQGSSELIILDRGVQVNSVKPQVVLPEDHPTLMRSLCLSSSSSCPEGLVSMSLHREERRGMAILALHDFYDSWEEDTTVCCLLPSSSLTISSASLTFTHVCLVFEQ